MRRSRSLLAALVAAAAVGAMAPGAAAAPPAQPGAPGTEATLTGLVTAMVQAKVAAEPALSATAWADTRVTVSRNERDRWAFGTVVLVAPRTEHAQPRDWLFVAEQDKGSWRVGLDGEPAFAELSARSPVVTEQERELFAGHGGGASLQAAGDFRTGMRLPYAVDQAWSMLGGPHAYDAGTGPWSSLDLAGGDQRVLAVRQGVAYTMCTGLIRVVHDRGYSSRYYHLWNHLWVDGASVSTGTFLGNTGTEVGCGGAARSRHVHFSLMQNGAFVGIAYHIIGKWVFRNGSAQYQGSALHGSTVAYVGNALRNYGALGFTQGIVDANGGGTVNRRSGPGTGYGLVGTATDGDTVSIACSSNGTSHTGRWGTTALWNKLTDGTWISDAFLYTGMDGPINGWC